MQQCALRADGTCNQESMLSGTIVLTNPSFLTFSPTVGEELLVLNPTLSNFIVMTFDPNLFNPNLIGRRLAATAPPLFNLSITKETSPTEASMDAPSVPLINLSAPEAAQLGASMDAPSVFQERRLNVDPCDESPEGCERPCHCTRVSPTPTSSTSEPTSLPRLPYSPMCTMRARANSQRRKQASQAGWGKR